MCTPPHNIFNWNRKWLSFSEHFDFFAPRAPCHGLNASRDGALGKNWPTLGIFLAFFAHVHTTIHGGGVTPPCAFRSTLIFSPPARHATGLTRQVTVPWAKLAYAWNCLGLHCPLLLLHTSLLSSLEEITSAWEVPMGCTLVDLHNFAEIFAIQTL